MHFKSSFNHSDFGLSVVDGPPSSVALPSGEADLDLSSSTFFAISSISSKDS